MLLAEAIGRALDPLMLIVALGACVFARQRWHLAVAVIILALIAETIVANLNSYRQWGDTFVVSLIASAIQVAVAAGVVVLFRKLRPRKERDE